MEPSPPAKGSPKPAQPQAPPPPKAGPREAAPPARETRPLPTASYQFIVRFYRRMKLHRFYPLVVELKKQRGATPPPSGASLPVVVRPALPGAVAVPAELEMNVLQSGARAIFKVLPLALGALPAPKVEIVRNGQVIQQIPLAMKGVRQLLTWVLLALAVLVPAAIIYVSRISPLEGQVPMQGMEGKTRAGNPGEVLEYLIQSGLSDFLPDFPDLTAPVVTNVAGALGFAYYWLIELERDNLSFYVFLVILGLTFISWVTHRSTRGRRRGKPLTVARSGS